MPTAMIKTRKTVTATYCGYIDLGAACFSVALSEIKPQSTVKNKIIFRSRIGDEFVIGKQYVVDVEMSPDFMEVISIK